MTARSRFEQHVVRFGSREIQYALKYGNHRDLVISVRPDLEVMVSAPRPATAAEIETRVKAKAPWILRQQLRYQDLHPLPVPRRFISGESHQYMGRQYRLRILTGSAEEVSLERPFLVVSVCGRRSDDDVRRLVQQWYRSRAEVVLPKRLQAALDSHPSLRAPDVRMRIRPMRTRWGSCSRTGMLSLNPELVRAPTGCIDYVIIHELCHRRVMNHGPEFQRLLTRVMPDWRSRRDRLNRLVGD